MADYPIEMRPWPNAPSGRSSASPPAWDPQFAAIPLATPNTPSTPDLPAYATEASQQRPTDDLFERRASLRSLGRRPLAGQHSSEEMLLAPGGSTPNAQPRPSLLNTRRFPLTLQLPAKVFETRAQAHPYTGQVSPPASSTTGADTPSGSYPPRPNNEYPFPRLTDATAAATGQLPTVLGMPTRFRPLWLLALGGSGNVLYGMGSVILERGIWTGGPGSLPEIGPGGHGNGNGTQTNGPGAVGAGPQTGAPHVGNQTALLPMPKPSVAHIAQTPLPGVAQASNPNYNSIWGGRAGGLAVGAAMTATGMALAATAATLLWQDNRRLLRRNHRKKSLPGEPSYFWPNFYYSAHLFGIGLLVSHRALIEATKDNVGGTDWVWIATLPGVVGSSIFSVTQAQSASGSEMYNGKMPLWKRHVLAGIARGCVATYCLFGAITATPDFNPYARESVRLFAMTAFTLACFLQLATARQLAANPAMIHAPSETSSWTPAVRWGLWLTGRTFIGFGPNLFARGLYTLYLEDAGPGQAGTGINEHHYNYNGTGIVTDMSVGSSMATAGVLLDLLATGLMRSDAVATGQAKWYGNVLLGGATVGTGCMVTYRGIIEYAKDKLSQDTLWLSTFPGTVGTALLFWTIPILFSYAELHHGDIPIEQRDRMTRVLRCIAGMGFPLWSAMAAITGFNPFIREAVFIGASLTFQLANSLPTTTTRRGQPQFNFPRTPGLGGFNSGATTPTARV